MDVCIFSCLLFEFFIEVSEVFFSWNACGKMEVTRPVQHKTNSTIKETIMTNAMRDKRAVIEIQIDVVHIMSVLCIVVVVPLVVVNCLSVVTSYCVVVGSSVVAPRQVDILITGDVNPPYEHVQSPVSLVLLHAIIVISVMFVPVRSGVLYPLIVV